MNLQNIFSHAVLTVKKLKSLSTAKKKSLRKATTDNLSEMS